MAEQQSVEAAPLLQPSVSCIGGSVRLATLDALAAEFGVQVDDAIDLLMRLDVPTCVVGSRVMVNIHAVELALFTATDPHTPLEALADVADMYAGIRRKALLKNLKLVGLTVFPDIRRRKQLRKSQQAARNAVKDAAGPYKRRGRPKGSRDTKPRLRRTQVQILRGLAEEWSEEEGGNRKVSNLIGGLVAKKTKDA